MYIFLC